MTIQSVRDPDERGKYESEKERNREKRRDPAVVLARIKGSHKTAEKSHARVRLA